MVVAQSDRVTVAGVVVVFYLPGCLMCRRCPGHPLLSAGNIALSVRALALTHVALVARRGRIRSEVHTSVVDLA